MIYDRSVLAGILFLMLVMAMIVVALAYERLRRHYARTGSPWAGPLLAALIAALAAFITWCVYWGWVLPADQVVP